MNLYKNNTLEKGLLYCLLIYLLKRIQKTLYSHGLNYAASIFMLSLLLFLCASVKGQVRESIHWKQALKQAEGWYSGSEAVRIADNVLLYQHDNGGWLKNVDMAKELSDKEKEQLKSEKAKGNTTIDNKATFTQMDYLLKVYEATGQEKYKEGFLRGVDYLLDAQYENGGWSQYYPVRKGYYEHITFNDGAMIGVMRLLRDVGQGKAPYTFVDAERRKRAAKAVDKGLKVILKSQVKVDGDLTAWCAQHDRRSLEPAKARAYELPSLSGGESAGVVQYLMEIEHPEPQVILAIESAIAWFEKVKITGITIKKVDDPSLGKGYDLVVVNDPSAPPLWARFYEIGTNRPMFVGRDGIVRNKISEIEYERRVGYKYYVDGPRELLEEDYPQWKEKWVVK